MAGKNVDEVYVAVDGVVSTGEFGVAIAPTSASSNLGGTWSDLGYASDAGVTESTEQNTTVLRAWQKAKKVRTLIEEGSVRYALTLIQTSADSVAFYYGGSVEADGSIVIDPTAERPVIAFNLDVIDGDNLIRAYAPEAQVIEVGDQVYANGEPIGYEVTVECAYNEALGGSVKKWYSALAEPEVPVIVSALPSGEGVGEIVTITGLNFLGATAVTFGGVAATDFTVDSADTIYATLPAGSAGTVSIVVTTPEGASTGSSYVRV